MDETFVIHCICTIGAGYVGTVTSAILAEKNPHIDFNVVDSSQNLIDSWNTDGLLPLHEPDLQKFIPRSNLKFSSEIRDAV